MMQKKNLHVYSSVISSFSDILFSLDVFMGIFVTFSTPEKDLINNVSFLLHVYTGLYSLSNISALCTCTLLMQENLPFVLLDRSCVDHPSVKFGGMVPRKLERTFTYLKEPRPTEISKLANPGAKFWTVPITNYPISIQNLERKLDRHSVLSQDLSSMSELEAWFAL